MTTSSATSSEPVPFTARIADPGPLGLAAFALTTFLLSCYNAELFPASTKGIVLGVALFYGGIVQIIAGVIEYLKTNAFGGTAFCSFGAFWLAYWYISTHPFPQATPHERASAIGLFLLAWTIFTAYMFVVSSKTNGALFITFGCLLVAFICLTVGDFTESAFMTQVGGWIGLLTAALAWYTSFAGVMNATAGKTVLTVFPRKS